MLLDILYTGCTIGSYSVLNCDDYTLSGKAKTDCNLLKLSHSNCVLIREKYELLNDSLIEFENYIEESGLPFCDYKLNRARLVKLTPNEKFISGVKRIINIVKFYKSSKFSDLLEKVHKTEKEKQAQKELRRQSIMMKNNMLGGDQKDERKFMIMKFKIDALNDLIEVQNKLILKLTSKIDNMETNRPQKTCKES